MKKITITLLLISFAGMALFAEGSQEDTTGVPGAGRGYTDPNQNFQSRGQMPMRGRMNTNQGSWEPSVRVYPNQNYNEERTTLTGKIDLSDVNLPKLIVGEKTYELIIPYRLAFDIDIKDGDEITIQGFEVPAYRRTVDSESNNLMVTGATFKGTDYDLNMMNYGPTAAYGPRPGMMNNYSPANRRPGRPGRFNNSGFQNNSGNWGNQYYCPYLQ